MNAFYAAYDGSLHLGQMAQERCQGMLPPW